MRRSTKRPPRAISWGLGFAGRAMTTARADNEPGWEFPVLRALWRNERPRCLGGKTGLKFGIHDTKSWCSANEGEVNPRFPHSFDLG